MQKGYDYFEWDPDARAKAKRQPAIEGSEVVVGLYDRETRMRVGDLIARAMRATAPGSRKRERSIREGIR